jgi:hypothetical protein
LQAEGHGAGQHGGQEHQGDVLNVEDIVRQQLP